QKEQLGVGHAILITRELVGNEPFAVIFPDDLIEAPTPGLKQLIDVYDRFGASVVAVERVPRDEVYKYGVIQPKQVDERIYQVEGLVEKPSVAEAPSDLTIVGR